MFDENPGAPGTDDGDAQDGPSQPPVETDAPEGAPMPSDTGAVTSKEPGMGGDAPAEADET